MKIEVDEMERIRNFQNIYKPKNLSKTAEHILSSNRRCDKEIRIYEDEIRKLKQEQQDLSRGLDLTENLLNREKFGLKPEEIYRPPNYYDQLEVAEASINEETSQADFKVTRDDGTTLYVELKATFRTLQDAIYNPAPIMKSKEWVISQGHDYRLLVILPKEFREDTTLNRTIIDDWLDRTRISRTRYRKFMSRANKRNLMMRTLYLPGPVYAQPVSDYFLNLPRNEGLFREKQERILEKIKNL